MNYAETLTYWYLRFNGFFPLTDFVMHRTRQLPHSADCDMLAIRHPYVYEQIGGHTIDWDPVLRQWPIGFDKQIVCLIVEVKSSVDQRANGIRSFTLPRLQNAINRFGVVPKDKVKPIAESLCKDRSVSTDVCQFVKLLISGQQLSNTDWYNLTLPHIDCFLRCRMETYRSSKMADRMFFQDDLIQYLAWRSGAQNE